jgi:hypothetical protein
MKQCQPAAHASPCGRAFSVVRLGDFFLRTGGGSVDLAVREDTHVAAVVLRGVGRARDDRPCQKRSVIGQLEPTLVQTCSFTIKKAQIRFERVDELNLLHGRVLDDHPNLLQFVALLPYSHAAL